MREPNDERNPGSNVVPFRRMASDDEMIAAVEEALRRMWARVAAEPLPPKIISLLEQLDRPVEPSPETPRPDG